MDTKEYSIVLSEAYIIINRFDKELYLKLPKNLINFIKDNRNTEFEFKYDSNKKLIEQDIKEETKSLISGIYLNYCVNETEKQKLLAICEENERKYQDKLREKYNPDNIFKKDNLSQHTIQDNVSNEIVNNNVK